MQPPVSSLSDPPGSGNTLVVLLHAYTQSANHLASVARVTRQSLAAAELLVPELPVRRIFSTADPNEIANAVVELIDQRWQAAQELGRPYESIVLVGHSIGALLARKAYVIACGEDPRAPFEEAIATRDERPWAGRVQRIVLLAGMNRGWRITHHLGILNAALWWLGTTTGSILQLLLRHRFLIFDIRRGAEFITQLRIQWLRMRQRAANSDAHTTSPGQALTVQLLGSVDDMVSPEDNIDLVSGGDFFYLDVPYSGHADVINMAEQRKALPDDSQTIGDIRASNYRLALTGDEAILKAAAVLPQDHAPFIKASAIDNVIFVIHGIRDAGYWTHKIARAVQKHARRQGQTFATETSSYGYFPMAPFLFAWKRREKVEWLMDQYAEAVAQYPNATFHFVGHSNGTYCLARALELYPCCQFGRIVFAGSVVRTGYDWDRFLPRVDNCIHPAKPAAAKSCQESARGRHGQVGAVLNFVASSDWVVAWFPKLFQTALPIQDLGSAGHDGFLQGVPAAGQTGPPFGRVAQLSYIRGSHSAAIAEANWNAIAAFIVNGSIIEEAPQTLFTRRGAWLVMTLGRLPWIVWAGITAFAVYLALLLFWGLSAMGLPEWAVTLGVVLYAFLMKKVVTKV